MSSPAPSNISQNDTKVLKKRRQEMQRRHEEEQRLLAQLEEVAKLCQAERAAQKARREAEAKAKEEAERQRVVEEEERKKRTMEYLQRLRDEVLEEEATLLEGVKDPRSRSPSARRSPLETRRCNSPPRRLGESSQGSTVEVRQ